MTVSRDSSSRAVRLVTRRDDPYIQFDDENDAHGNKPDYWIAVKHRVRMCKPCYKSEYEEDAE